MAKLYIRDLAAAVAPQFQLSQREMESFINRMFDVIREGLDADKQTKIKGLGTFKITTVKARESINVSTGERVLISGHDKMAFTPDSTMKELINKPFSQFETVVLEDGVDFPELTEEEPLEDTQAGIQEEEILSVVEDVPVVEEAPVVEDVPVVDRKSVV
mgnify:CR=1 FL=1